MMILDVLDRQLLTVVLQRHGGFCQDPILSNIPLQLIHARSEVELCGFFCGIMWNDIDFYQKFRMLPRVLGFCINDSDSSKINLFKKHDTRVSVCTLKNVKMS